MVVRSEFEQFAERELPGLLRHATMLTGDTELARDLVQDVLLQAHRRWDRVSSADHPVAYVRTMLVRAYLSWRRRWSVRHVVTGYDASIVGPDVPDHAQRIADRADLWSQLAELPRQQRAVLVLRYYEHLTDVEIAQTLGCSAGTVRGYASRALATLRLTETGAPALSEEKS